MIFCKKKKLSSFKLFILQIVPRVQKILYFINSSPQEYTLVSRNVAYCEGKQNSEFLSFSIVSDL